jgi:hypothetical protein
MAHTCGLALADPLPESLRIQQEEEKKDQQKPVVRIDRPNAHHRMREAPDATGANGDGVVSPDQPQKAPADTETH